MTYIRCTSKLLKVIGGPLPAGKAEPHEDDWYANLLWFERRKCLLVTHAATLFSIFEPHLRKATLADIGRVLVQLITHELAAEDLPKATFGPLEPSNFVIARTSSRSVLGSMTDMRYQVEAAFDQQGGLSQLDLFDLNRSLRRIPFSALKYERPIDRARALGSRAAVGQVSTVPPPAQATRDRIDDLFDRFLAVRSEALSPKDLRNYIAIIDLFKHSLNQYAYESLPQFDRKRWDRAFNSGEEDAYCKLFGAEKIPGEVGAFVGYFMIRKVAAPKTIVASTGRVITDLLDWLVQQRLLSAADVAEAGPRAQAAASALPKAEKLAGLLYDLAERSEVDVSELAEQDHVEDFLTISRVEKNKLWFEGDEGEIGPLEVEQKISSLAEPGWSINLVMGRVGGRWQVMEVGSVYPD